MGDYREEPWQQDLRENVQRGIKFLDEESPKWYHSISTATLEMDNMGACVCGYVFRGIANDLGLATGYEYFTEYYALNAIQHGFDCPSDDEKTEPEYSYLAELWIEAANKKLANEGMVW